MKRSDLFYDFVAAFANESRKDMDKCLISYNNSLNLFMGFDKENPKFKQLYSELTDICEIVKPEVLRKLINQLPVAKNNLARL